MRRRWWLVGAGVAVLLAGVAGLIWWKWHQSQETGVGSVQSGGGSIALDTSGTHGTQGMNAGGDKGSVKGVTDLDAAGGGASGGAGGAAGPAPSKEELAGYDKYQASTDTMYGDVVKGTGAEVKAGSKVTLNYRLWLTNGTLADDSYAKGQAFAFTVGEHRVISGFEVGLVGMKAGGRRRLIVPPAGGYGDKAQGSIPANSVLVFDVEMVQVQ